MTRLPPPCAGFDEDLSAFLDGALAPDREEEVRAHLDLCDACVRRLEVFALADAAVAAEHAQPAVRPRVVPLRRRRWLGVAAGAVGALAAGLAALLLARPEAALRDAAPELPATMADRQARLAPASPDPARAPAPTPAREAIAKAPVTLPGATSKAPAPAPPPDDADGRLATATDDELDLVDEIDTIEDLELIENLELVERLAARGRS